jgi:hypothetical protein
MVVLAVRASLFCDFRSVTAINQNARNHTQLTSRCLIIMKRTTPIKRQPDKTCNRKSRILSKSPGFLGTDWTVAVTTGGSRVRLARNTGVEGTNKASSSVGGMETVTEGAAGAAPCAATCATEGEAEHAYTATEDGALST